jgi:protein-tyrosine phosphatase
MSRITPLLYLGGAKEAQDYKFLKDRKIRLVVNAAMEIPNYFPRDFEYLRLELDDQPSQDLSHVLEPVAAKIVNYLRDGKGVYVHCAAGISRSTSMVIYTLMKMHHWNYDRAFKYLKTIHPRTQPNSGFVEQLVRRNTTGDRQTTTLTRHPVELIETSVMDDPRQGHTENRDDRYAGMPPLQKVEDESPHSGGSTALLEPQGLELKKMPLSKYKRMENGDDQSSPKEWTQLTFDCPDCEQPSFTPTRRGVYARIFT